MSEDLTPDQISGLHTKLLALAAFTRDVISEIDCAIIDTAEWSILDDLQQAQDLLTDAAEEFK